MNKKEVEIEKPKEAIDPNLDGLNENRGVVKKDDLTNFDIGEIIESVNKDIYTELNI